MILFLFLSCNLLEHDVRYYKVRPQNKWFCSHLILWLLGRYVGVSLGPCTERIIIGPLPQVQAYRPGLEKSGCIVNNLAEFTVDPKDAGKAPLKIFAQVSFQGLMIRGHISVIAMTSCSVHLTLSSFIHILRIIRIFISWGYVRIKWDSNV